MGVNSPPPEQNLGHSFRKVQFRRCLFTARDFLLCCLIDELRIGSPKLVPMQLVQLVSVKVDSMQLVLAFPEFGRRRWKRQTVPSRAAEAPEQQSSSPRLRK
ncbi:hypothetical protein U1Q18_016402 [Sarracenia purpurea var. burkii]